MPGLRLVHNISAPQLTLQALDRVDFEEGHIVHGSTPDCVPQMQCYLEGDVSNLLRHLSCQRSADHLSQCATSVLDICPLARTCTQPEVGCWGCTSCIADVVLFVGAAHGCSTSLLWLTRGP